MLWGAANEYHNIWEGWRRQSAVYTLIKLLCTQPLSCWTRIYPAIANSVDQDQLASEEANWSGSALFAIKYVNL